MTGKAEPADLPQFASEEVLRIVDLRSLIRSVVRKE